jgi:peptidoglycan/LPS O-acetylase OafA/YrhL
VVIVLNAVLVPVLFGRPAMHWWQKTLGGIAYPFFLSHWAIGTLIIICIPAITAGSVVHCAAATLATMLFSLLMYYGVDRQVQRVRTHIKNGSYRNYLRWRTGAQVASAS